MSRRITQWMGSAVVVAVAAVTTFGCAQQPSAPAAAVDDKTYAVTPASVAVQAGIIKGEVTEMKVTERVENGSNRVVSPAKLSGTLKLKNTSANQTVRLIAGKILYLGAEGRPIELDAARTAPALGFSTYSNERLDPGQETTQSVDVAFPAEALKAKALKEIRLELTYIPSAYSEQTIDFRVSLGEGK